MAVILVVDDDPLLSEVVCTYLERAGFSVHQAEDGRRGLQMAGELAPDLMVLDVMLPGLDGIEVCRRLRAEGTAGRQIPIVMLSALGGEVDRILGLQLGADDYLTKPFSPRELVLRVQSILRRAGGQAHLADAPPTALIEAGGAGRSGPAAVTPTDCADLVRDGDLAVDPVGHRVFRAETEINLTVREFDLLLHLLRNPGRTFSRDDLMTQVWGWQFGDLSTVTVHVRRLRAKIEADPARPTLLVTVWGKGYRWEADPGRRADPASGADTKERTLSGRR